MEADQVDAFRRAGRALFSLGLVRDAEGNLSKFDGVTFWITRTGSDLGRLQRDDVLSGPLDGEFRGASSDIAIHLKYYREQGPGSVAHAHPPGSVPERGSAPGAHGVYVFAPSLAEAVEEIVRTARANAS